MTEITFGKIEAEFRDNQVIVKQISTIFAKEIRRYSRIPDDVCNICLLPENKCQNHPLFLDEKKESILNGLLVASYYKKRPFNRITEEITLIRSNDNLPKNNLLFIIFKEIIKAAVSKFEKNFDIISCPPTMYNSIKEIIKESALELNIPYMPIEKLIDYDKKLHDKKKIRDARNSDEINELVMKMYKPNGKDHTGIKNLLLVDDIIKTGATINRISNLLKNQGVRSVYGFAWLRATG